ncbi:MAG: transposase [Elusimicrobiota bacterium]|nr:transposase [Elusimicrobiota bacterium]
MKFRKHIRLKDYDYSTNGYYFATIVTKNRLPLLCSGGCKSAIEKCINELPKFICGLSIDYFVVMDNHIHIIFVFDNCTRTLGKVVSAIKSAITKIVAANVNSQKSVDLHQPLQTIWQWNYYEHIIRNEKALDKIRKYIDDNPDIEKPNWDELDKC